jgi:hypothetical protein
MDQHVLYILFLPKSLFKRPKDRVITQYPWAQLHTSLNACRLMSCKTQYSWAQQYVKPK